MHRPLHYTGRASSFSFNCPSVLRVIMYTSQSAIVVQPGVCVDIFVVTNEYTNLASLKFLGIENRDSLFLYSNTDDSTLPQDKEHGRSRISQVYYEVLLFRRFWGPTSL